MLSKSALTELIIDQMLPGWRTERLRLDRIDRWYRWDPEQHQLPPKATIEHKALLELSKVPWLGLVVTCTAQAMYVDGYRSRHDPIENRAVERPETVYPAELPWVPPEPPEPEPEREPEGPWRIWMANHLDKRQTAIHRAALAYGYSFATVLPGTDPMTGKDMPRVRGVSPRKLWAVYEDLAEDDWPEYAMQVLSNNRDTGECRVKVFDENLIYTVQVTKEGAVQPGEPKIIIEDVERHGAGVCPVVRYTNQLDLDGRTPGEIEPHIPLAARINKTSYDRMLVQHFNSWKIRYIAGMQEPDDPDTAQQDKLRLRQEDLLVADDPDTKFGSLPETTLDGFIRAHEADVEALAAVTQTPTHELTGNMVNLSAEALAAARASQTQKIYERQKSFGASHVQALRLAAALDGDSKHAEDITGRVTWQDTSIRSLAQAVDALGKAAQMLQVPVEALWGRIPGVEKSDVEEWRRIFVSADPITRWQQEMARQAITYTPPQPAGGAADGSEAAGGSNGAAPSKVGATPAAPKQAVPKVGTKPAPKAAPKAPAKR